MAINTDVVFYYVYREEVGEANILVYDNLNSCMIAWQDKDTPIEALNEIKSNYEKWASTATEQDLVQLIGAATCTGT